MQKSLTITIENAPRPILITSDGLENLLLREALRVIQDGLDAIAEPSYFQEDVHQQILALRDLAEVALQGDLPIPSPLTAMEYRPACCVRCGLSSLYGPPICADCAEF